MGRTSDSGLVHGVSISPQESLEQAVYAGIAQAVEEAVYHDTMIDEGLLDELERRGVKFNREDVVFVTKDQTGQIIWLETGNKGAGLEHLLHFGNNGRGHAQDFMNKCGVSEADIPAFLREVIAHGAVVESKIVRKHGRDGISRKYLYNGQYLILAGIGTNGFLVSAYPV